MRRCAALLIVTGIFWMPAAALAQTGPAGGDDAPAAGAAVPSIDVVEIVGVIDRPTQRYAIERLDEAEREGAPLLVFQVDSLGGMKIADGEPLPPIVRRIRDASIPVAVHVGPRAAHAAGTAAAMAAAAHVVSVGLGATMGPALPLDHAHPAAIDIEPFLALHAARGRQATVEDSAAGVLDQEQAVAAGWADLAVPGLADMLDRVDGRAVTTAAGPTTIRVPRDEVDVRFFQPGPLRRLLHTLANPALMYLLLVGGAVLLVFEVFQPGFGVAGFTAAVVLAGAAYGLTVLPVSALGLGVLIAGLLLLTLDVALDGLGVPTGLGAVGLTAGSLLLLSGAADPVRLSPWLIGFTVASALVVFVPVMTVVRRARQPLGREARARLIGEGGQVRSMLNPEGFVSVDGEVWRARSKDGSRMRVGEDVTVDAIDGSVLIVRSPEPANGTG